MAALHALRRLAVRPVQPRAHVHCFRETLTDGLHVGLVVVAHDGVRRDSTGRERAAEERLRRLGVAVVAVVAEQHVEDLAVLVDGSVQGALLRAPVPKEEALVHRPCPAGPSTVLADRRRAPRPEGLDPPQGGPLGDVDAPLPRSARNTITLVAESGWPSYQRTASRITSGGQRYPEKAAIEGAVKVRWQGRHRKRWRPAPSRPWRLVAGRPHEVQRGIRRGPYQPQTMSRTP